MQNTLAPYQQRPQEAVIQSVTADEPPLILPLAQPSKKAPLRPLNSEDEASEDPEASEGDRPEMASRRKSRQSRQGSIRPVVPDAYDP